ncbi:hypothetical protein NIES4102_42190 (plasmid) [Chondrocystis sp. NIES-4102]|nr:hypothetical protein NIES4102_41080 [Chondrocystis sp. NIES-4102]BAZ47173.1 hypothetical protein NIES4102_42190 [Chondrocystis sp. NIES-4102]
MGLTNCSNCQYYNSFPHHQDDICCSVQPAYATMYSKLKDLDSYSINCLPLDDCNDFQLDPQLVEKTITFSLTFQQWQQLARDSSCTSNILNFLQNLKIEYTLSLTISDWQAIANHSYSQPVLQQLEQQQIYPNDLTEAWIEIDSSCINATAYNQQTSILKIRFNSGYEYKYFNVSPNIFADFCAADSKGKFFNQYIKDIYDYSI